MAAPDLSSILAKATSLNNEQVALILNYPASGGFDSIGEALAARDVSTAEEIVSEICREMGLDFIKDIPVNDISVDLVRDIPINYAKENVILPFKEDNEQVVVLTSNPMNYRCLDDLRVIFGKKTKPLISTTVKILDAINRVYEKSTANLAGLDEIEQEDYDLDDPIVDL
ncbi:MAG: type II secretion system protein GspE, partial [Bdellovibrio sp.]